jgi:hypothetical protein
VTRATTRRIFATAASLGPFAALAPTAHAVLFHSTADPAYNSTAPADPALLNSGWQLQGTWNSVLGTPIAPEYFITAAHVGGAVGQTFTVDGTPRTTVRFADGADFKVIPDTDLRLWRVNTPFSSYATLYNAATDGVETNKAMMIFGRGTRRGADVNNGTLKGWQWGPDDNVKRWGQNVAAGFGSYVTGDNALLKFTFDAPGNGGYHGVNEVALSRGDSGGGVFIKVGSAWKLAGINYAVLPSRFSYSSAGPAFEATLFDIGGMHYQNSSGTLTFQSDSAADVPTENYASRISSNYAAIRHATNAWGVDADGNFVTAGLWANALAPTTNYPAYFGSVITAPRTVTLNTARSVASLGFDNANRYTLAGNGALILANTADGNPARVGVQSGSHTVGVNVVFGTNATVNVAQAASTLTLTKSPVPDVGANIIITKTGAGTLELPSFRAMDLTVGAGTVKIAPNGTDAGTSNIASLVISPGGKLDLGDNDLVLDYSSTSYAASARNWLLSARDGGSWAGTTGITSSAAAADLNQTTALAYAEAADLLGLTGTATTSWSGQTVDATSLLVKYTYYGDANFDGQITPDDFSLLDRGRTRGLTGWINGDFNYDNVIDNADQALIDRTYLIQSGTLVPSFLALRESQFGADYVSALVTTVPEPTLIGLAAAAAPLVLRRRSRRT